MPTTKPARTKLQRDLAGATDRRRPTPLDAFRLARRKFLAAERIDMSALADELGVNRVTLYRWVGSREQLLVEVVWSLGSRTSDNAALCLEAARHGTHILSVKPIAMTRQEAVFVVRDEGNGFDPSQLPDPTDPANLERVSGRGLLLIQTFMDQVEHNERGNEITMRKRKSG